MKRVIFLVTAIGTATCALDSQAGFVDTFDTISSEWVTDRYDPAGFDSVFFDGDNRLRITVDSVDGPGSRPGSFSSSFYNTQGRKRETSISGDWTVSGEIFVSSDMIDGNSLRRTDLWTRTGLDGSETGADYPIMGVAQLDPSDPLNHSATGITPSWRVWDSSIGWNYLSEPVTTGWHDLEILGSTDTIGLDFYLDGSLVYSDTTATFISAGNPLTDVFVQAYNFGEDGEYYWDNVSANNRSVPDGGSTAIFVAFGLIGTVLTRRRL